MAAAQQSLEARELALVDKVELRIALADSDSKLQNLLNTYLAPLLLKLASEHLSVRNKVISVCQHINTRTKALDIALPVAALLKQFKDHSDVPLIRHFDLLYIQQGFSRLSTSEAAALLSELVNGIASANAASTTQGATIFNLLLRSLNQYEIPRRGTQEDLDLRKILNVSGADAEFLSFWFGKLLLLRLGPAERRASICAGLSKDEFVFLTVNGNEEAWNPAASTGLHISRTKTKVVRLLFSGLFQADEKFLPSIFAASEPDTDVSSLGEDLFKHVIGNISLEDDHYVPKLFEIYFGTFRPQPAAVSSQVMAVKPPTRVKILSVLTRTETSINETANISRLVREDLLQDDPNGEQISKGNREVLKLRIAVVEYLSFVGRRAAKSQLAALAPSLVQSLKTFLEHETDNTRSPELKRLRGNVHHIIGTLAAAYPPILVEPQLKLLRWFFQSLSEETDKDIIVSIDEAISITIRSFQSGLDIEVEQALRNLLLEQMSKESSNARNIRYVAVRFANRCLSYGDVAARWIDIKAAADGGKESFETVEEARKGLDPHWFRLFSTTEIYADKAALDPRAKFPSFTELINFVYHGDKPGITSSVSCLTITYGRQILIYEALHSRNIEIEINNEWERKLDLAVTENEAGRKAVRSYLAEMVAEPSKRTALSSLWLACFNVLVRDDSQVRAKVIHVLLDLCALSPDSLIGHLSSKAFELNTLLLSNDIETRTTAAQAFGLLASHPDCDISSLDKAIQQLTGFENTWNEATGAGVNKVHGSMLSLAFWSSYSRYRLDHKDKRCELVIEGLLTAISAQLEKTSDTLLVQGCCSALGQLCIFYAVTRGDIEKHFKWEQLVDTITKKATAGNERAIQTLGQIAMILHENEDAEKLTVITDALYKLHELRQPETQFIVGEAMTCLACGWESSAMASKLPYDGAAPVGPERKEILSKILDRSLTDCSKSTKPSLKKAAVIWLLCLIQFCGRKMEIQKRLQQFQTAFKRCLSDRDDIVQESASRGLGLLYEIGSREIKDALVQDLVGSFSNNRADMSGTVSEDTQLFEEGALPTGDGSIKTYKDIMSLAAEVGDSSLVYRFMSLASNNAIWSSRAAFGRFGLSNVFSDSSVDGYLAANPKLYPKLYRYRFDPNTNVRRAMNDIWNSLIKDSTATINKYFDAIIDDLLLSIIGREWRVRQASCTAIADLIQGRELDKIEPYLDRVWTVCFKVLDDIKDSVRVSAAALARVLIGLLTRSLESSGGSSETANKMLKSVLPFLMSTSGIESNSREVKAISITTLLDIVKKSQAKTLRPFVPDLIENIIGLLSALEPEEINYIHLNASKFNMTEQKIDELRLTGIRNSPLMETIDRCIDMLDDDTMKSFIPRLQLAMRNAVGMPSKVGCSRVLVSLSTRRSFLFRPYADTVLSMVPRYISDRNETVSGSYAAALGYVARGATNEAIIKLTGFAKKLYFESEDDRSRIHSGEVVQSVAKHATDRFTALAAEFLPFVFVAQQDEVEEVKEIFKAIWDDNVGGPRATSMYLKEILDLASQHLASRRWVLKHGAALAVAAAITAISVSKREINETEGELFWPLLLTALADKSWDGKEQVLNAFALLVESGQQFWTRRPEASQDIRKVALREARRRNEAYRQHAITALGRVAAASRDHLDLCDDVYAIVKPLLEELVLAEADEGAGPSSSSFSTSATNKTMTSAMDIDQDRRDTLKNAGETAKQEQRRIDTIAGALTTLVQALVLTQDASLRVRRALDLLLGVATGGAGQHRHTSHTPMPVSVKSAAYSSASVLLDRLMSMATMTTQGTAVKLETTFSQGTGAAVSKDAVSSDSSATGIELVRGILMYNPGTSDESIQVQITQLLMSDLMAGSAQDHYAMPESAQIQRATSVVKFAKLLAKVRTPTSSSLRRDLLPAGLASERSATARALLQDAIDVLDSSMQ